jgi:hypothetical protein
LAHRKHSEMHFGHCWDQHWVPGVALGPPTRRRASVQPGQGLGLLLGEALGEHTGDAPGAAWDWPRRCQGQHWDQYWDPHWARQRSGQHSEKHWAPLGDALGQHWEMHSVLHWQNTRSSPESSTRRCTRGHCHWDRHWARRCVALGPLLGDESGTTVGKGLTAAR